MSTPLRPSRLLEIDGGRGLANCLMVIGYLVPRDYMPRGNDWWQFVYARAYSLHTAFFVLLSGYIFFLTRPVEWNARLRRSAVRLVPLVYVAKRLAAHFLPSTVCCKTSSTK